MTVAGAILLMNVCARHRIITSELGEISGNFGSSAHFFIDEEKMEDNLGSVLTFHQVYKPG